MVSEVIRADRPSCFSWSVLTEAWDIETSVWTFLFESAGPVTTVTETFSMKRPPKGLQTILDSRSAHAQLETIRIRTERLDAGIKATLANLKAFAEKSPARDLPLRELPITELCG